MYARNFSICAHYQMVISQSIPFSDSRKQDLRPNCGAMEIQDIRRRRLAKLIEETYGSQAAFIEATNENQGEVSALLRDKSFGEKKARKIEKKCGLPAYWLDGDMAPLTASAQAREVARAFDSLSPELQNSLIGVIEGFGAKVKRVPPEAALVIGPATRNATTSEHTENNFGKQQSSGSSSSE